MKRTTSLIAIASSLLALTAMTAVPGAAPVPDNGTSPAALAERVSRWRAELPQGTGKYRVVRLIEPDLAEYTIYRPADMRRAGKLPIISFANGACRNTSTEYAAFLSELASHGYLVIAVGRDDQPFDLGPNAPKTSPDGRLRQVMDVKVLTDAVD